MAEAVTAEQMAVNIRDRVNDTWKSTTCVVLQSVIVRGFPPEIVAF
jgi:hypothetical protein